MAHYKSTIERRPLVDALESHSGKAEAFQPPAPQGFASSAPLRLLRLAQVMDVTGLGKSKIYELQSAGDFPMRVQITAHSVGWIEEEVQNWIAGRAAARAYPTAKSERQLSKQPSR